MAPAARAARSHRPVPPVASDPDTAARASRRRAQHLRAAETFVVDDLWWLAEIDRGYAWVRQGDGGNGYAVICVGQGIADSGRRVYGPTDAASQARQPPRRAWRDELRRRGLHATERRVFLSPRRRRRHAHRPNLETACLLDAPRRRKRRHRELRRLKILRSGDEASRQRAIAARRGAADHRHAR